MAIIAIIIRNGNHVFRNPQKLKMKNGQLMKFLFELKKIQQNKYARDVIDLLYEFAFEKHEKAKLDHVPRIRIFIVH